jgi:hypothetical protein
VREARRIRQRARLCCACGAARAAAAPYWRSLPLRGLRVRLALPVGCRLLVAVRALVVAATATRDGVEPLRLLAPVRVIVATVRVEAAPVAVGDCEELLVPVGDADRVGATVPDCDAEPDTNAEPEIDAEPENDADAEIAAGGDVAGAPLAVPLRLAVRVELREMTTGAFDSAAPPKPVSPLPTGQLSPSSTTAAGFGGSGMGVHDGLLYTGVAGGRGRAQVYARGTAFRSSCETCEGTSAEACARPGRSPLGPAAGSLDVQSIQPCSARPAASLLCHRVW